MNKRTQGFTVIELIIVILILAGASILFFTQKNTISTTARDQQRKTAINAMYYSLEEVFYAKNSFYPSTITSANLPSVDPDLLLDPYGVIVGDADSDYRYEATNCTDDKCKAYTLRSSLENEADFVKQSKHN